MIMSANGYTDCPFEYTIENNKIVMKNNFIVANLVKDNLTLDVYVDEHLYSYLLEKVK